MRLTPQTRGARRIAKMLCEHGGRYLDDGGIMEIHIDFETRGSVDLKETGAWIYAQHPDTDILCVAYCEGDGEVILQTEFDKPYGLCDFLARYALNPQAQFVAHNAAFEQAIWHNIMVKRYGFPPVPPDRWKCTMVKAMRHGLPGKLEKAAQWLDLPVQKDMAGNRIMQKLSKPRRQTKNNAHRWWTPEDAPADFDALYKYCIQDVEVERLLDKALRDLSHEEQQLWVIDQHINQHGILLDRTAIRSVEHHIEAHTASVRNEFHTITGGINPTRREAFRNWLGSCGVFAGNLQTRTVKELSRVTAGPVRRALELYAACNRTSLAKYAAMRHRSDNEGILRESLQFHGAHTGRWAGRGVQLQNLARPAINADLVIEALPTSYDNFKWLFADVSEALVSAVRGMIIARPQHRLIVGDFSQIEALVLAWLAGQQNILQLKRNGGDLYCDAASGIFNRKITKKDKNERHVGKTAVLALGYGGGIASFATMAANYGVSLQSLVATLAATATEQELESADRAWALYCKRTEVKDRITKGEAYVAEVIKQRWRAANPRITQFWSNIESAAVKAVDTGKPVDCGPVRFFCHGAFLHCKLPSGRTIAYFRPEIESTGSAVSLSYRSADYTQGRTRLYGGSIAENIVQAVSRDLMASAIKRLWESGYRVILTVHDEIVCEVPEDFGSLADFTELMTELDPWAAGCVVEVEAWEGKRYGKR